MLGQPAVVGAWDCAKCVLKIVKLVSEDGVVLRED
jgi:hypothetical protein